MSNLLTLYLFPWYFLWHLVIIIIPYDGFHVIFIRGSVFCKFSERLAAYRRGCSTTTFQRFLFYPSPGSWERCGDRRETLGTRLFVWALYSSYLARRILVELKRLWRDQTTWPKSDIRLVNGMMSSDVFVFLATRNFTSAWGPNPKWASEKDPVLPCSSTTDTIL